MKFSYNWIAEFVQGLSTEPAKLERLVTLRTAECEGIIPFGGHWDRVRAVRILDAATIGKGKNQRVRIEVGNGETRDVVCGAPNVRPGMLAAWVPPGTDLDGRLIGTLTIEGVTSAGMLASSAELGLSRDSSGLLELHHLQPGDRLPGLRPDWILEIDNKSLTHRPDLWGHYGMAREIAAILNLPLLPLAQPSLPPATSAPLTVEIEDLTNCPRYSALLVENVSVTASPLTWAARLASLGLHTINNIVDVTNLLLTELPQPMHAFDADKLAGPTIFVRRARRGERLNALNGEVYQLDPDDQVIADASGPIALAGVIGGVDTAISAGTTRVVLESANFHPTTVRLTSSRLKLRTDASMRFEKSLDPETTLLALHRALHLIQQTCPGATAVGSPVDRRAPAAAPTRIVLPAGYIAAKLGAPISVQVVEQILHSLGFETQVGEGATLAVRVPTWRATKDVSEKADLVEEVGRMIGYDNIPPQAPLVASVVPPENPLRSYLRRVRQKLVAQGFTEVYRYSFLSETDAARFGYRPADMVAVANPIASDLTHLRPSLLPGLWRTVLENVRHFREFRVFEIGSEIHPQSVGLPQELPHVAAVLYSAHADEQDFFEMKRVLETLLPGVRVAAAQAHPFEHPFRAALVSWLGRPLGRLFEIHPGLLEAEGIEGRAMVFDLDLHQMQRAESERSWHYQPPRRYPTSPFDLSVVTALHTPVAEIYDALTALGSSDLAQLEFVRQYDGPPMPPGQKSVTYHLEVGALDHTVTAEEATAIRNRILDGMLERGFEFRGQPGTP